MRHSVCLIKICAIFFVSGLILKYAERWHTFTPELYMHTDRIIYKDNHRIYHGIYSPLKKAQRRQKRRTNCARKKKCLRKKKIKRAIIGHSSYTSSPQKKGGGGLHLNTYVRPRLHNKSLNFIKSISYTSLTSTLTPLSKNLPPSPKDGKKENKWQEKKNI